MFLDIGGKPLDFWDLTVLEIREMIESYNRVNIQKQKEKITYSISLEFIIFNCILFIYCLN